MSLTSPKPDRPRTARSRALLLGGAAGAAYGAWALIANRAHGIAAALRAALAQCFVSFVSTLFMVLILERLFALGSTPARGFWTAAIGTTMVSASLMATTHAIAGTPRIFVTIAPLVAVAAVVYTTYAWRLRVARTQCVAPEPRPRPRA
jgi:hypothetical protein